MPIDIEKVSRAVTEADDAFRADHRAIFGSDAARLKSFYATRARRFKDWDRSGPCLFRGCTNPSIARSHSVQRAKVLERIAEQGHLLTPQVDDKGEVVLTKVGVNLASTFPGFCEVHENLFADFESTGLITEPRHLGLQMMRTVCREIARVRFQIAHLGGVLVEYRAFRQEYFSKALLSADGAAKLQNLEVEGDEMEARISEQLKRDQDTLKVLSGALYREVMDYVEHGQPEPACIGVLLPSDDPARTAMTLPIAMAGFAFVHYRTGKRVHTAPCTIAVVPQDGPTLISFGTSRKHRQLLPLLKDQLQHIFSMLNLVESWMVFGSDHWFIIPSIWNALPAARQTAICAGICSRNGTPGVSVAPSIFDEIRNLGLAALEPGLASRPAAVRDAEAAILAAERAKLSSTRREDLDELAFPIVSH